MYRWACGLALVGLALLWTPEASAQRGGGRGRGDDQPDIKKLEAELQKLHEMTEKVEAALKQAKAKGSASRSRFPGKGGFGPMSRPGMGPGKGPWGGGPKGFGKFGKRGEGKKFMEKEKKKFKDMKKGHDQKGEHRGQFGKGPGAHKKGPGHSKGPGAGDRKGTARGKGPMGRAPAPRRVPKENLEQKVDRLLKEVQELRKELQGSRGRGRR